MQHHPLLEDFSKTPRDRMEHDITNDDLFFSKQPLYWVYNYNPRYKLTSGHLHQRHSHSTTTLVLPELGKRTDVLTVLVLNGANLGKRDKSRGSGLTPLSSAINERPIYKLHRRTGCGVVPCPASSKICRYSRFPNHGT